ncbi:Gag-Pol polyprotein [Frankliniella fusca]|uniref:Gag-Pol polyprotein n=1 Tax=Frankliniella fusca TaxID=407009 RepID=A0AAE1LHV1_9NEOP|nr:Gag-Pol polyprotein [Frankliniella fusca]
MIMSRILTSLPQEYRHFKSAWESVSKSEKLLDNLIGRLQLEESSTSAVKDGPSNVAFQAYSNRSGNKATVTCFSCGKKGHYKRDCHGTRRSKIQPHRRETLGRKELRCWNCKNPKNNHDPTDCFFRKRKLDDNPEGQGSCKQEPKKRKSDEGDLRAFIQENKKTKKDDDSKKVSFLAYNKRGNCENVSTSESKIKPNESESETELSDGQCTQTICCFSKVKSNKNTFCVDSGCTCHLTENKNILLDITESGDTIKVAKKG